MTSPRIQILLFSTVIFLLLASHSAFADRIVLRSLKMITDRTVESFDEDGVKLDNGMIVHWDEIEKGTVAEAQQQAFDKLLADLGTPLYRIRQRLKTGDYEGLLEHAEAIYPKYLARQSSTAYMVFQSLMWGRLAAGQREQAVEPYLRAYEYLRAKRTVDPDLPGDRRLRFDPSTALSTTLPPVWFDSAAAKTALPGVVQAVRSMKKPYPEGVFIYYATLASAAGDKATAENAMKPISGNKPLVAQWRDIAKAQLEVTAGSPGAAVDTLEKSMDQLLSQTRPAAKYWIGMAKLSSDDKQTKQSGVLELLHLPAVYGTRYPELAGAALYQSMHALDKLNDIKGSIALRKELMLRYAHTVHAHKVKSETNK